MSGTDSEVAGTSSAMSSMNMENARKTDNPKLIFSPEIIEINVGEKYVHQSKSKTDILKQFNSSFMAPVMVGGHLLCKVITFDDVSHS